MSVRSASRRPPGLIRWLGWGRLLLVPPIVGSFLLIWWSIDRLAPYRQQADVLSEEVTRLNLEIESMERTLAEAGGASAIEHGFQEAQAALLRGRQGVEQWLRELEAASLPVGMDLGISFGKVETRVITNHTVSVVPVELQAQPRLGGINPRSPYRRLLELLQYIATLPHRVDMVEVDVRGGTNSVEQARLALNLWATELQAETSP